VDGTREEHSLGVIYSLCDSEAVHSIATMRDLFLRCGDGIGKTAAAIEGVSLEFSRAMGVNG